jgi:hypothetical protein
VVRTDGFDALCDPMKAGYLARHDRCHRDQDCSTQRFALLTQAGCQDVFTVYGRALNGLGLMRATVRIDLQSLN